MANSRWEISSFGWDNIKGVYCVCELNKVTGQNTILYVGSSANIGQRLSNSNHPYRKLFQLTNSHRIIYVKYKEITSYKELEKKLINRLKPKYNIQYVK